MEHQDQKPIVAPQVRTSIGENVQQDVTRQMDDGDKDEVFEDEDNSSVEEMSIPIVQSQSFSHSAAPALIQSEGMFYTGSHDFQQEGSEDEYDDDQVSLALFDNSQHQIEGEPPQKYENDKTSASWSGQENKSKYETQESEDVADGAMGDGIVTQKSVKTAGSSHTVVAQVHRTGSAHEVAMEAKQQLQQEVDVHEQEVDSFDEETESPVQEIDIGFPLNGTSGQEVVELIAEDNVSLTLISEEDSKGDKQQDNKIQEDDDNDDEVIFIILCEPPVSVII